MANPNKHADNKIGILLALNEDLTRHDFESHSSNLLTLKSDILERIKCFEKWANEKIAIHILDLCLMI
jgi:hypothetical protein